MIYIQSRGIEFMQLSFLPHTSLCVLFDQA
jgi:hypothetical protein